VRGRRHHGTAVPVDPTKPMLKPPGTKRSKLKYDESTYNFAFNFNLRRYIVDFELQLCDVQPSAAGAYTSPLLSST
jgi:hypothetical protein